MITLSHFGPTDDPEATIADADDGLERLGHAAREGYRNGGRAGIAAAVDHYLPIDETIGDADVLALWRWLSWDQNNISGLEIWAKREEADKANA